MPIPPTPRPATAQLLSQSSRCCIPSLLRTPPSPRALSALPPRRDYSPGTFQPRGEAGLSTPYRWTGTDRPSSTDHPQPGWYASPPIATPPMVSGTDQPRSVTAPASAMDPEHYPAREVPALDPLMRLRRSSERVHRRDRHA